MSNLAHPGEDGDQTQEKQKQEHWPEVKATRRVRRGLGRGRAVG